eukprot:675844-Hanusia_phi.AAC.1
MPCKISENLVRRGDHPSIAAYLGRLREAHRWKSVWTQVTCTTVCRATGVAEQAYPYNEKTSFQISG